MQPQVGSEPANFLFFFFLTGLSVAVGGLFTAVVYYHFVICSMTTGRNALFGNNDALWMTFEEKLGNLQMV